MCSMKFETTQYMCIKRSMYIRVMKLAQELMMVWPHNGGGGNRARLYIRSIPPLRAKRAERRFISPDAIIL